MSLLIFFSFRRNTARRLDHKTPLKLWLATVLVTLEQRESDRKAPPSSDFRRSVFVNTGAAESAQRSLDAIGSLSYA
jgi:hypothetical protein